MNLVFSCLIRPFEILKKVCAGFCEERAKVILRYSLMGAFIIGMAAHAFAFFNYAPVHDALNYIDHLAGGWEVSLGRFFQPVYGRIRGEYSMPWLSGMLSMLYIGLASFLLNDLFDTDDPWLAFLTAGFLTANATMTNLVMAFTYAMDVYALSLLFAVAGAYAVIRLSGGFGAAMGSVLFAISMGFYQSYVILGGLILVFYAVLKAVSERHLLRNEGMNWIWYVLAVVMTALVYSLIYRYFLWSYGTEVASAGSYNSPAKLASMSISGLVPLFREAYHSFLEYFLGIGSASRNLIQMGTVFLCLIAGVLLLVYAVKERMPVLNLIVVALAVVLFPGAAQVISVLSGRGKTYFLTAHALFLMYPALIGILNKIRFQGAQGKMLCLMKIGLFRMVVLLLSGMILYGNIRFSNEMYTYRAVQYDKTMSYVTRLMERIDSVPGYVRNETEVVFSGYLSAKLINTHEPDGTGWMEGMNNSAITYLQVLRSFIHMMGENMNIPLDYSELPDYGGMEEVKAMPAFPDPGCSRMIDGRVLVKLSDF